MNNKVENVCVSAFVYRPTSAPDLKGELGIGDFSHGVIFPLGPDKRRRTLGKEFWDATSNTCFFGRLLNTV